MEEVKNAPFVILVMYVVMFKKANISRLKRTYLETIITRKLGSGIDFTKKLFSKTKVNGLKYATLP